MTNKKRGFALLTPEKMREIASQGGAAAHKAGRAHKWTPTQAREAAMKSVLARQAKRTAPNTP